MSSNDESARSNCFGCGRVLVQLRDMPRHQPQPNASESDRCTSRPRKYANLRCQYAVGHECVHSAKVSGTGLHYWRDEVAA
jgi:hypothetical protein